MRPNWLFSIRLGRLFRRAHCLGLVGQYLGKRCETFGTGIETLSTLPLTNGGGTTMVFKVLSAETDQLGVHLENDGRSGTEIACYR